MRCALRFEGDRFATPEEQRREDAPGKLKACLSGTDDRGTPVTASAPLACAARRED
jgi:hypothetical protein